jgi:tetratricopeptide (TPR) repeat protein
LIFQNLDKKDWLHRDYLSSDRMEGIRCLSNALICDPDDGYIWHELGDRYADFDLEKAEYCWKHAKRSYKKRLERFKVDAVKYSQDKSHLLFMDISSSDVPQIIASMYFSLGSIHMNLDEHFDAVEAYKKSFAIKDNDPDCLYLAGEAYYYEDKLDDAEKMIEENLELTDDYRSYYLLGMILWKKGKFFSAQENFWNCIEWCGHDADSCYYKHLAYHALGNPKKTEAYLKKAFELESSTKRAFDLIKYYEETGRNQKCKKYYDFLHKIHKKVKKEASQ